jgi:hypothetical protein
MSRPQSDKVDVILSEAVFDGRALSEQVEPMRDFALKDIRRSVATYNVVAIKAGN